MWDKLRNYFSPQTSQNSIIGNQTCKSGGYSIRIAIIYRPPYSERHPVTTNVFLTEFPDYLESLLLCKERLLITGDFNIHVDDCSNPDTQKFLDLLDSFDLQQHVKQPTHRDGHLLHASRKHLLKMSQWLIYLYLTTQPC